MRRVVSPGKQGATIQEHWGRAYNTTSPHWEEPTKVPRSRGYDAQRQYEHEMIDLSECMRQRRYSTFNGRIFFRSIIEDNEPVARAGAKSLVLL